MTRRVFRFIGLLVGLAWLLASCAPAAQPTTETVMTEEPTQAQPAGGKEITAVIGYTASQTGSLNVESTRQKNGLSLWMK